VLSQGNYPTKRSLASKLTYGYLHDTRVARATYQSKIAFLEKRSLIVHGSFDKRALIQVVNCW
jgi:hypothetical protein